MMKRKFLAVILPIIGCATLVGSGFSAWYFSDTVISVPGKNGIAVDFGEQITTGNLSIGINEGSDVREGTQLVLDQGGADVKAVNYTDRGIFFTNDANATDATAQSAFNLKINATYGDDETLNLARLNANELKIEIRVDIEISNRLLKYVEVNRDAKFNVTRKVEGLGTDEKFGITTETTGAVYTTYSYVYYPSLKDYTTQAGDTWTLTMDVSTKEVEENGGLVNSYLTYKKTTTDEGGYLTGGKPTTTYEYNAMVRDLTVNKPEGEHFVINYSIGLVADLTTGA